MEPMSYRSFAYLCSHSFIHWPRYGMQWRGDINYALSKWRVHATSCSRLCNVSVEAGTSEVASQGEDAVGIWNHNQFRGISSWNGCIHKLLITFKEFVYNSCPVTWRRPHNTVSISRGPCCFEVKESLHPNSSISLLFQFPISEGVSLCGIWVRQGGIMKMSFFRIGWTGVQTLISLTSHESSGKPLGLLKPQFPHLWNSEHI